MRCARSVHERRVASSGHDPRAHVGPERRGPQGRSSTSPDARGSATARRRPAASPTGCRAGCCVAPTARDEWMVFDRPAGSERDLVVLAGVLEATVVQRHPAGSVRVVGGFGVLRWQGFTLAPRAAGRQLDRRHDRLCGPRGSRGARGDARVRRPRPRIDGHRRRSSSIGPMPSPVPPSRSGFPTPPPLRIRRPRRTSPRSVTPSPRSTEPPSSTSTASCAGSACGWCRARPPKQSVEALGGTRHTSGRRYSYDDPLATVIAVSEDGPVSVLRNGEVLGRSRNG